MQYEKKRPRSKIEDVVLRILNERRRILEPDLKRELLKKEVISYPPSPPGRPVRKSIPPTYYRAINKLIVHGRVGERATIVKRCGRKISVRVFNYIGIPEDLLKKLLAGLGYEIEKKKFGERIKYLPPEAISIHVSKLRSILSNHSTMPVVVDFLMDAIENKRFDTERESLVNCLLDLVRRGAEEGNEPLLSRVRRGIGWLKHISGMVKNRFAIAEMLLKLGDPNGLDMLLDLLKDPRVSERVDWYGGDTTGLFLEYVRSMPQVKERIIRASYEVLRADWKENGRKNLARAILGRII